MDFRTQSDGSADCAEQDEVEAHFGGYSLLLLRWVRLGLLQAEHLVYLYGILCIFIFIYKNHVVLRSEFLQLWYFLSKIQMVQLNFLC